MQTQFETILWVCIILTGIVGAASLVYLIGQMPFVQNQISESQKPKSGKFDDPIKWFMNELHEFQIEYIKYPRSQACALEIFDILGFFVIPTMNVDKTKLYDILVETHMLTHIVKALNHHLITDEYVSAFQNDFVCWLDKKQKSYPIPDDVPNWRWKVIELAVALAQCPSDLRKLVLCGE